MSTTASGIIHHSANVTAVLVLDGERIPLSKIGPHRIYLVEPRDLPRCRGIIRTTIDGEQHEWNVELTSGAVPFDTAVEIASL